MNRIATKSGIFFDKMLWLHKTRLPPRCGNYQPKPSSIFTSPHLQNIVFRESGTKPSKRDLVFCIRHFIDPEFFPYIVKSRFTFSFYKRPKYGRDENAVPPDIRADGFTILRPREFHLREHWRFKVKRANSFALTKLQSTHSSVYVHHDKHLSSHPLGSTWIV